MQNVQWKYLIGNLALSLGLGGLSALLTNGSMKAYGQMYHPPLAPPGWLFPVVWTILFTMMGIAAYRVGVSAVWDKKKALRLYGAQLMVNFVWPILFFELQAYWVSFLWLILLWYLLFLTWKEFKNIDRVAGRLLIPYLLWVTFAGYLTLMTAIHYSL